jgi:hypothetical protein
VKGGNSAAMPRQVGARGLEGSMPLHKPQIYLELSELSQMSQVCCRLALCMVCSVYIIFDFVKIRLRLIGKQIETLL